MVMNRYFKLLVVYKFKWLCIDTSSGYAEILLSLNSNGYVVLCSGTYQVKIMGYIEAFQVIYIVKI